MNDKKITNLIKNNVPNDDYYPVKLLKSRGFLLDNLNPFQLNDNSYLPYDENFLKTLFTKHNIGTIRNGIIEITNVNQLFKDRIFTSPNINYDSLIMNYKLRLISRK